jgi:hypothetical protein
MDNQNVKRGIDFSNRVGERTLSDTYRRSLAWWKGGKLDKRTLVLISFVFLLNFIIIFPLFGRNVTGSFASSAALMLIANILHTILFINKDFFFSAITIISLSISPIAFYLFVRKIALRHELTAFIATLLFILPNPFFDYTPALGASVIYGDGAHAVIFSLLPLFLLYVESFVATGIPVLGVITAIGTGIIAIISPFVMFNLLIIYPMLTIAEGFLGNLRIKLLRMSFLLVAAFGLSLFWYFPTFFSKGLVLSHVAYAIDKSMTLFPLLIPLIPIFGALFFLVFDRRKRLKPIFIGLSLLIIYLMLYSTSKDIMIGGIFTPERYRIELSFAGALSVSIFFIIIGETIVRSAFVKAKHGSLYVPAVIVSAVCSGVTAALLFTSIQSSRLFMTLEPMQKSEGIGVGNIVRIFRFSDILSLVVDVVSLATFLFLIHILKIYPSLQKKLEKIPK